MKKAVIVVIGLAVLVGAAGYWSWQKNPYSKEVLKLDIIGPESVAMAEEVIYTVRYKNNGDIRLENPRLIFEFPDNTLSADGSARRVEIGRGELDDIYPGEEKTIQFKGRLIGKQGEIKTARAEISFQPRNLQAEYKSESSLSTVISSVPLTFDFDLSSRVESGRSFEFSLNYFSSLAYPLTDLSINIEYPDSFEFLSSSPNILDKTQYNISLLNRAEGGRLDIIGSLDGELGDQKIFKAVIGVWQNDVFIPLKEISKGAEITKPQLSVFAQINGQTGYVASPGDLLHYEIFFRNISEDPFTDLFLVSTLSGSGFDFDTMKVTNGDFTVGDNSVVWDWRKVPKLRFLPKGEEGKVEFWVELKEDWTSNAVLTNSVLISEISEKFETKVNSNLKLTGRADYHDEVFGNSGPNPAEVGSETTFTVTWQVDNSLNDIKNGRVRASLPSNVRVLGKIFPESQSSKFAYDSHSREIVWLVGDVGRGETKNIAFQVGLTPGSGQRGNLAPVVQNITISGEDQWTEQVINRTHDTITTPDPIR